MSTVPTGEHNEEDRNIEFGLFPDIPQISETQLVNCVPATYLTLKNIRDNGAFYEFDNLREDITFSNCEGDLPLLTSPYQYREYKLRHGTDRGRILTIIYWDEHFSHYLKGFIYYTVDYKETGGFVRVNEGTFTMNLNLRYLLGERMKSNMYLLDNSVQVADLSALATDRKFTPFVFDGSLISNKAEFFHHFGMVMQPPEVFVYWDYLESQLKLTEWIEAKEGIVIIYKNVEYFYKSNRKEFDVLISIFLSVIHLRNKRKLPPLIVFLQSEAAFNISVPLHQVTLSDT